MVAVAGVIIGEDGRDLPVNSPVLQLQGLNQTWEGRARRAAQKMRLPVADIATRSIERFLKKHKVQVILGEYLDCSLKWLPVAQELGFAFLAMLTGTMCRCDCAKRNGGLSTFAIIKATVL